MLYIIFKLRDDRYALDTRRVVEVLPLVDSKQLPKAELGIAGVFDYRGTAVPLIDLCALAAGRPALRRLSTRIILVTYDAGRGATQLLGLIAEGATETMRRAESDFTTFGLRSSSAPYLGPVTRAATGLIQRIDVDALLPAQVRASLFDAVANGAGAP